MLPAVCYPLRPDMRYAHFVIDFEGWPKGNPEIEIHILGQAGSSDSLQTYSCAGERASGSYYQFNMDEEDWSGSVLLLSEKWGWLVG